MLNTTSKRQDLIILIFCYESILQKISRMLKPLVPKFHPHLSVRLKDIAEKAGPRRRGGFARMSLETNVIFRPCRAETADNGTANVPNS